jgi:Dyp-type peroxidase family
VVQADFSPDDELRDIQGGLIGFNKDHQQFHYVNFHDGAGAKQLLTELLPQLANGYEVLRFNAAYGENRRHHGDPEALQATWVNLWLTRTGLTVLDAPSFDSLPEEFRSGMANRPIGDVGVSAPDKWIAPFTSGAEPHAVVVIAGDNPADMEMRRARIFDMLQRHSAEVVGTQIGDARPGEQRGKEHFGFKDGISQPGIDHFTKSSKSGSIPPGEVLIGYRDADGNISGEPPATRPPVATTYGEAPLPVTQALPSWTHNGSFVVYRRLRQDVAAFRASMTNQAPTVELTPDQLGAKLVGRWPSGAPMERVPGLPTKVDPSSADPSVDHPDVLDNAKINKFDFSDDVDGTRVPRAAHIRKMNPRADQLADGDSSGRHRMLRRGIPYGPEFVEGESAYGEVVPDIEDRGLLFVNYQASISRTFEFVQSHWANREDFQQPGDGKDPMISQDTPDGTFSLPPARQPTFARWVTTTGGVYAFAPSLAGLAELIQAPVPDSAPLTSATEEQAR